MIRDSLKPASLAARWRNALFAGLALLALSTQAADFPAPREGS